MKLKDFLKFILQEELRIELEVDDGVKTEFDYKGFWLTDYRSGLDDAKYYDDYEVVGFVVRDDKDKDLTIQIMK